MGRPSNNQSSHTNPASSQNHKYKSTLMFRSKSPAKAPSPRPTAQQNTKLLHALFMNEENKRDPYTRRPSTSTPSIPEPTSRRSSEGKSEDEKTGRTSQDGTLHVIGQEEGSLRTSSGLSCSSSSWWWRNGNGRLWSTRTEDGWIRRRVWGRRKWHGKSNEYSLDEIWDVGGAFDIPDD